MSDNLSVVCVYYVLSDKTLHACRLIICLLTSGSMPPPVSLFFFWYMILIYIAGLSL